MQKGFAVSLTQRSQTVKLRGFIDIPESESKTLNLTFQKFFKIQFKETVFQKSRDTVPLSDELMAILGSASFTVYSVHTYKI